MVRSLEGERVIPARDFFIDTFVCAIEPTEILVEVRFPVPPPRSGGAYEKLERKAGDFATAGAAVQVTLGTDGPSRRPASRCPRWPRRASPSWQPSRPSSGPGPGPMRRQP